MGLSSPFRKILRAATGAWLVSVVAGCLAPSTQVRSALQSPASAPVAPASPAYTLACPDVLDLNCAVFPAWAGRYAIEPDGAIVIPAIGRLPVAGKTVDVAAHQVAAAAGIADQHVRLAVAEHKSRLIFLFGPGSVRETAIPYRGPETVIDFLRRSGGLPTQANTDEIHVIRSHVSTGRRPEVFDVDLTAILVKGDASSNITLQPYDQVYVGATRRSALARYLPGGDWTTHEPTR